MEERFLNSGRNCTVLLCTAVFGALLLGTNKLGGQFFITCMEFYNVGRKDASFPFTLLHVTRCLSGPLTGYLGRKYGAMAVTEFGSLLCVVGVGGCFFAKSMTAITILWGVVYGMGTGLGTLLIPHIMRDFFVKHYDKAHGCYVAGSGIGGFLLPLLTDVLLRQYGQQGTFLILSALMLNVLAASIIMKSLKRGPHMYDNAQVVVHNVKIKEPDKATASEPKETRLELTDIESHGIDKRMCKNARTVDTAPSKPELKARTEILDVTKLNTAHVSSPSTKNDNSMADKNRDANLSSTTKESRGNIFLEVLQIFIDPSFVIILITQGVFLFVQITAFMTVIDFARDIPVPPDIEVYSLVNIGVSDVVGRIAFGYVTDGGCLSQLNFYVLCFVLLGMMISAITVVQSTVLFMIVLSVIGLMLGGIAMISIGLLFNFIEKEKTVIAMPSRLFLFPFLGLTKPFLIEYFREGQGSYNGLMFLLTGMCFFSAILSLLLPAAKRFNEKREAK